MRTRCRTLVPRNPSLFRMVAKPTAYQRDRHLLTPAQRTAVRYMITHGTFDRRGWAGTKDEMDALEIIMQACQSERGECPAPGFGGGAG